MQVDLSFTLSAFIAGFLTFLAPCTFPLVPAYIGFISGSTHEQLKNSKFGDKLRRRTLRNSIFFSLGFSVVFIFLGMFASVLGQNLGPQYRAVMAQISGVVVIIFGFIMLGIFNWSKLSQNTFLSKFANNGLSKLSPGTPLSSFLMGFFLAFGWTPCIGPILGAILTLALNSPTSLSGGYLLAVFSLGLAIPFILVALSISVILEKIKDTRTIVKWAKILGGIILIIIGILLLTNNFGILIKYGYDLFRIFGYEDIQMYL